MVLCSRANVLHRRVLDKTSLTLVRFSFAEAVRRTDVRHSRRAHVGGLETDDHCWGAVDKKEIVLSVAVESTDRPLSSKAARNGVQPIGECVVDGPRCYKSACGPLAE